MNIRATIARLFASYSNAEANTLTIAAYMDWLQRIPPDEIDAAISQAMLDSPKFIPPAPAIHDTWRRMTTPEQRSGGEAWGSVVKALKEVGSWGKPKFADPLTARVVDSLGWQYLCQSEDQMADRAHFLKMYEELRQRAERQERLLPEARQLVEHHAALRELTAGVVSARQITQRERETV